MLAARCRFDTGRLQLALSLCSCDPDRDEAFVADVYRGRARFGHRV
jgi:hypothetical protein